jgi:hypothetical protein
MANPEEEKRLRQINLRAWRDEAFKHRLMANPTAVLREMGLNPPKGVQIKVVENSDSLVHLPLYARPKTGEISEEDLKQVAGGLNPLCGCICCDYGKAT